MSTQALHRISILVRTRNEARYLPETLQAVRDQHFPADVECVLVDSGSTDGTLDIARRWGVENILALPPAEFTFGRALNLAARQANGDILVSLSAHARPVDSSWLECLVRPFDDPRVAGVYGRQCPRPGAWPPVAADCRRAYGDRACIHCSLAEVSTTTPAVLFSNANAALRRDLWARLPFSESLPACEDQDWARRAIAQGYCIAYEPGAAVYHSHNEGPQDIYRRRAREEQGWRRILPNRRITGRDFWDAWYGSSRADLQEIAASHRHWPWLILSPAYRFLWALGQWMPSL